MLFNGPCNAYLCLKAWRAKHWHKTIEWCIQFCKWAGHKPDFLAHGLGMGLIWDPLIKLSLRLSPKRYWHNLCYGYMFKSYNGATFADPMINWTYQSLFTNNPKLFVLLFLLFVIVRVKRAYNIDLTDTKSNSNGREKY